MHIEPLSNRPPGPWRLSLGAAAALSVFQHSTVLPEEPAAQF